jgi:MFS superfamily sulfate permease-like transporter
MFAYAIFGTSRLLSVGPDSATAILSFAVVSTLGMSSESEFIALTAALAMLVGVITFYLVYFD